MCNRTADIDFADLINELVEVLRECEDGIRITTCQLIKAAGYDHKKFDTYDLLKIHSALFKAAKKNHIILDMSSHEDKVEGLPFCLDYIVRNKKA